jgi:hypothetical protein
VPPAQQNVGTAILKKPNNTALPFFILPPGIVAAAIVHTGVGVWMCPTVPHRLSRVALAVKAVAPGNRRPKLTHYKKGALLELTLEASVATDGRKHPMDKKKNCVDSDRIDGLEERRTLRSSTTEVPIRLRVSRVDAAPGQRPVIACRFSPAPGSRKSIHTFGRLPSVEVS